MWDDEKYLTGCARYAFGYVGLFDIARRDKFGCDARVRATIVSLFAGVSSVFVTHDSRIGKLGSRLCLLSASTEQALSGSESDPEKYVNDRYVYEYLANLPAYSSLL